MNTKSDSRSLLFPIALAVIALAWRVAKLKLGMNDALPNFSPWLALAFAGAAVMPKQAPWFMWPALLLGVDLACHPQDIAEVWLVYVCLGASALWGSSLRGKASVVSVLGGTIACSVAFYLITSTQAFLMSPSYVKSFTGWLQAITLGDPNWQPQAWVFFVRSLLSDIGFSSLLVLAYNSEARARDLMPMPVAA
jgi:hypothetical protein